MQPQELQEMRQTYLRFAQDNSRQRGGIYEQHQHRNSVVNRKPEVEPSAGMLFLVLAMLIIAPVFVVAMLPTLLMLHSKCIKSGVFVVSFFYLNVAVWVLKWPLLWVMLMAFVMLQES